MFPDCWSHSSCTTYAKLCDDISTCWSPPYFFLTDLDTSLSIWPCPSSFFRTLDLYPTKTSLGPKCCPPFINNTTWVPCSTSIVIENLENAYSLSKISKISNNKGCVAENHMLVVKRITWYRSFFGLKPYYKPTLSLHWSMYSLR